MTPERWQQVKSALGQAMALSAAQRVGYLARIGAADPELRREVSSLLAADEEAGSRFLQTPAPQVLEPLGPTPVRQSTLGRTPVACGKAASEPGWMRSIVWFQPDRSAVATS